MFSSVNKIIQTYLSQITNVSDRDNVILMLILVGIRHYTILYDDMEEISKFKLKNLCEKYVSDLQSKKTKQAVQSNDSNRIKAREIHPRLDSTSHYPFVDTSSTVDDILKSKTQNMHPNFIFKMGPPAQKRYVAKIFDEMRFENKSGIALYDLPDALERLGISISRDLRRLLTISKSKNDSDIRFNEGYQIDKYISLEKWRQIVKRLLNMMRNGIDIQKVSAKQTIGNLLQGYVNTSYDGNIMDNNIDYESNQRNKNDDFKNDNNKIDSNTIHENNSDYYQNDDVDDMDYHNTEDERNETDNQNNIIYNNMKLKQRNQSKQKQAKNNILKENERKYKIQLRNVQSKLSTQIKADKEQFKTEHFLRDNEALQSIAKSPVGKNLITHQNESVFHGVDLYERNDNNDEEHNLSISSDDTPRVAHMKASVMLGLVDETKHNNTNSMNNSTSIKVSTKNGVIEKNENSNYQNPSSFNKDEVKNMYAIGWKSTKGGWVADFGAPHTHALYVGAENNLSPMGKKPWQQNMSHNHKQLIQTKPNFISYNELSKSSRKENINNSNRNQSYLDDESSVESIVAGIGEGEVRLSLTETLNIQKYHAYESRLNENEDAIVTKIGLGRGPVPRKTFY
eukprot:gene11532-15447_t